MSRYRDHISISSRIILLWHSQASTHSINNPSINNPSINGRRIPSTCRPSTSNRNKTIIKTLPGRIPIRNNTMAPKGLTDTLPQTATDYIRKSLQFNHMLPINQPIRHLTPPANNNNNSPSASNQHPATQTSPGPTHNAQNGRPPNQAPQGNASASASGSPAVINNTELNAQYRHTPIGDSVTYRPKSYYVILVLRCRSMYSE